MDNQKITPKKLIQMKNNGEKFAALTAYDALLTSIITEAGIEVILVGDSLGMVFQGKQNTLEVTIDEMIYHTKCVSRTNKNSILVTDMPFMSYQVSPESALENAGRIIKYGCAEAVKLEGGGEIAGTISKIASAGIPVMGHIGLTPQDILTSGGYFVQGISDESANKLKADAKAVSDAGAFAIVIECVPAGLAKEITGNIPIPTIGIGAGPYCDGQILVTHDMLGIFKRFRPKFVKSYANLYDQAVKAVSDYSKEVKNGSYPTLEHSY